MNGDMHVGDVTFVAFDFETTGLASRSDRIIEIGAVKFRGTKVIEQFTTLVDPEMPVPASSSEISGITSDMLQGKPRIGEVLGSFLSFLNDSVLLAHNAMFDMGFLRAALQASGLSDPGNTVIDTQVLARRACPGQKSYSLQNLVEAFAFSKNTAHRAMDDAMQCMKLFQFCCDALSFMGDISLKEVLT